MKQNIYMRGLPQMHFNFSSKEDIVQKADIQKYDTMEVSQVCHVRLMYLAFFIENINLYILKISVNTLLLY